MGVHVAIVGGGVAGLATCKALCCRGIPCTLFDGQDRLGGLWVSVYPGATPQVPKHAYELADHRFPPSAPRLPSANDVCEYCEGYASKWDLWPHIRLHTLVTNVSRLSPSSLADSAVPESNSDESTSDAKRPCDVTTPGFSVEIHDTVSGQRQQQLFSHVVLATGLCSSQPNVPKFGGEDIFRGRLLHSSERSDDAAEFAGKQVLVVGSGKSALDASLAAVRAGATAVTQTIRTSHWPIPVDLFGVIPYDWVFHNRLVQRLLRVYPSRKLNPVETVMRGVTAPVRWLTWRVFEMVFLVHYFVPRRGVQRVNALRPSRTLDYDLTGEVVNMIPEGYLKAICEGQIRVRRMELEYFTSKGVMMTPSANSSKPHQQAKDGQQSSLITADTVVLATGWKLSLNPLSKDLIEELQPSEDGLHLYKYMLHPKVPGLMFVGNSLTLMNPLTSSIQAAWLGELLLGHIPMPTAEEMLEDLQLQSQGHGKYPMSPLRSKLLNGHGDQYHDVLLRDMKVRKLARYGGLLGPLANLLMPREPKLCHNAVQPVDLRSKKTLKPPRLFRVTAIAVTVGCAAACSAVRAHKRRC